VIVGVVSPVDHKTLPVELLVKVELPQLSVTVITGVGDVELGLANAEPAALVQDPSV